MTKEDEIENIARSLFEIDISKGQILAYEEGHDKLFGLPMRSRWENMGFIEKRYYRNLALKEITGNYMIDSSPTNTNKEGN